MIMHPKVQKIIATSQQVIRDCALKNGAIVAANTDKEYYPRVAKNYRYVWPRDAAFICVGAEYLGIEDIQEPFFDWLFVRPEDFKKDSLLYQNYSTNGRIVGQLFQPDQTGAILWAIHFHFQKNLKKALKYQELIERLAKGLCTQWHNTHFHLNTADLWESRERITSTTLDNNFTYSLAACARGLLSADQIIPNPIWKETARQMIKRIEVAYDKKSGYFLRNYGKIKDLNVDASLLGLVWPFAIYEPDDPRMIKTVEKIEEKLVTNGGGVHRFEFDYYDGEGTAAEGSGAWPLLNFWLTIYWQRKGNEQKAEHYFNWVLDHLDEKRYNGYLPEQIFPDFRTGIYPLAWSHAMFACACHCLNYLNTKLQTTNSKQILKSKRLLFSY